MKRRAAALIGAVAAGLATTAQASPFFDAFQKMCVAPRADNAAAFAAADAMGWMPIPDTLLKQFSSAGLRATDGRMKTDRSAMQFMLAGTGERDLGAAEMKMNFCAVGLMPRDASLRAEAEAWVKVSKDPGMSKGTEDVYIYTEEAGVRSVLQRPNDEEAKAILRQGRANFLFSGDKGEMSLLMFAVPTI